MSIITVEHLSHGFGDRAIFNDVSFRLLKGEHIGLIGANGEGKSTFMNIITGKLQPDEGRIEWAKNVRIGYLDQHTELKKGMTIRDVLTSAFLWLFEMEEKMTAICDRMSEADETQMETYLEELGVIQDMLTVHDFYLIDSKVEEVARALGLTDIGIERDVTELSGGQRTKVLLGKLLLEKPDVLLLDEPTNYLDEQHIEWLRRYLNEYENAFILISHDIPFLNSVINIIYHMENQEFSRYVGDYDEFMKVREVKRAQLKAAYDKQQKEIAGLKDFVARNKARVATRNMAMSRQKKLDKMDLIELTAEKPKPEFNFQISRTPGRYIFTTKDLIIGYDEPLSRPLSIEMERGQKIVLTGANGIGKTTLLRSLLGLIPPISGSVAQGDFLEIGYFEQETEQGITTTCIEEIWKEFPSYSQYEVRSALAKCGLTPVQADQPPLQCTSFGRAYQPSGSGRQRRTLSRIIRIQGKYPDGLPRTRILPRSRYRCLGLYTVDNKTRMTKAGITRRPKCRAFSPPDFPGFGSFTALFSQQSSSSESVHCFRSDNIL